MVGVGGGQATQINQVKNPLCANNELALGGGLSGPGRAPTWRDAELRSAWPEKPGAGTVPGSKEGERSRGDV